MKAQIEYRPESLFDEALLSITTEEKTYHLHGTEAIEAFGRLMLGDVTPDHQFEDYYFYEVTLSPDFYENWLRDA